MEYQVQIVFHDPLDRGWIRCMILDTQPTEQCAFDTAERVVKDNGIMDAEIWVLAPESENWKVRTPCGEISYRPVTPY